MKTWSRVLLLISVLCVLGYAYWKFAIPTHRVNIRSELVMLGDLDNDNRWTSTDLEKLDAVLQDPFSVPVDLASSIDMNQNGMVDEEDLTIIRTLVFSDGDPYVAEEKARAIGQTFPRPRELYRYISTEEYRTRPLWGLSYPLAEDSVLDWLVNLTPPASTNSYAEALDAAIYTEAIRFDQAWRKRESKLLPIEKDYAERKLSKVKSLFLSGEQYELLLALTELVEDAETLTVQGQPEFIIKLLALRDHLRELLSSQQYSEFKEGTKDWRTVLRSVSSYLKEDLDLTYDLETLGPARNLTDLSNYLQRAEWQYYKSTSSEDDFRLLVAYAQHNPRYLRVVSQTNKRHHDLKVENHNLPMVLLFREALRIKNGDKRRAAGLLDESIRIPYAWVKSIPREALPSSLALDNFLLPGNMEDGADKSRHWNVFGGICLYKSPQESLDLALKRELQDLRDAKYSEEAMREFLRDMIANLNGMYHVMSVNPDLLAKTYQ
jgi:hypothetical protein